MGAFIYVLQYILCLVLVVTEVATFPKPPRVIPAVNPTDPPALPPRTTKSVLIVGGGLAGLSAALELSERGYNVTIKEAEDVLGGRLFTRAVQRLGQTFHVEHGFHGWFHNYHQFKDIRQRLDIDGNFRPWKKVDYVFKKYKPESIYSEGPYPLNLMGIILRSPNLKFTDAINSTLALPDLLDFDYDTVYKKYENITLDKWAQMRKVDQKFYDIIMRPALSVTLNERGIISAAEMLMYMQLYFLSDAKADVREFSKFDYGTSVINPWAVRLTQNYAKIMTSSKVEGFRFDPETGRVLGDIADNQDYDHVIMATNLVGVNQIVNSSLTKYRTSPKVYAALSKLNSTISGLHLAPPYKVMRVWFDQQLDTGSPSILETPDFSPVNLIAQYSELEQEYIDWASKTNGSVIEFHLYAWKGGNVSDDKIWGIISPTVKEIYPEIIDRDFKILAYHVNSFQNFPSFRIDSERFRPNSTFAVLECDIPNLVLAGDWLHTSYPSALMERAVSTGREAANQVLLSDHVMQSNLTVTSSHGPGLF